jgi:hypothetical protein
MVSLIYRYDISNDGQIDQKELTKLISAMVKFWLYSSKWTKTKLCFQFDLVGETDRKGDHDPKHRAQEIIAKLDVGGDKKLNKQEFIAGYILFNYILLIIIYIFLPLDARMILLFVDYLFLIFKILTTKISYGILSHQHDG